MTHPALKPCPFCGHPARYTEAHGCVFIHCTGKDCRIQQAGEDHIHAAMRWNRRVEWTQPKML